MLFVVLILETNAILKEYFASYHTYLYPMPGPLGAGKKISLWLPTLFSVQVSDDATGPMKMTPQLKDFQEGWFTIL